ncbi:MAG: NnrS family protein [Gammaproteobacteria bacterium]|nr:NnrS family protein [Gammaproteobacteria bacterium]
MRWQVFAAGFRPAFLAAGLAAFVLIPVWAAIFVYGAALPCPWPPTLWHAHEMMFGFIGAAIAGFLLTAVPNWTGHRAVAGAPLAVLLAVWLAARIAVATASWWPAGVVAAIDLAFFPLLATLIAPSLLRAGNRNWPLLLVLGAFTICDAIFHVELLRRDAGAAMRAILVAIDLALLLVTVIGGRIVPAFTTGALRGEGVTMRAFPGIGPAAIVAMVAVALVDAADPGGRIAAVTAGAAALIQALRLAQWRSGRTLSKPLVWVLHLGYAWIPLGLALKCAALLGGIAIAAFWLHALTVGALATMILGVATRAALGHSGRPLEPDPRTVIAYAFLLLAGLVRVFGLALLGLAYPIVILIAAFLWTGAFGLFLWVYVPILLSPRADGRPG